MHGLVTQVIRHIHEENNHWGTLLLRWQVLESEVLLMRSNIISFFALATGGWRLLEAVET